MSSMLHPVGPERRTTYWRRRLVVVLVLIALVVAITVLVRSLGSDADAQPKGQGVIDPAAVSPTVTGTPPPSSAPATPSPSTSTQTGAATATPSTSVACSPAQLSVTAATDVPVYGPNANPQLKVIVQNTAGAGCETRVGAGTRTFVVRDASGAQVYSSADCAPSTAATTVGLLAKDQEQGDDSDTTVMTQKWSRERSAPGCPTGLPAVEEGVYTLTGTWNDVPLTPVSFSLTG
ncbi:hypothetical protein [Kineococcus rubinsiae]|uniref:hypothetical protein n=1 Tax=Kineococcus rubinsiae TaxID=2609562 RepID=UPI0014318B91|nr:hypothetical protein [Kineococcus rubinsiae]NIZ92247.1 hypothetical protein [Kineococcus rubinsiae]